MKREAPTTARGKAPTKASRKAAAVKKPATKKATATAKKPAKPAKTAKPAKAATKPAATGARATAHKQAAPKSPAKGNSAKAAKPAAKPVAKPAPKKRAKPAKAAASLRARVLVYPRREILDPQGKAIRSALAGIGFGQVEDVRAGKSFEITLRGVAADDAARALLTAMCEKLLANPVVEDYAIELPGEGGPAA